MVMSSRILAGGLAVLGGVVPGFALPVGNGTADAIDRRMDPSRPPPSGGVALKHGLQEADVLQDDRTIGQNRAKWMAEDMQSLPPNIKQAHWDNRLNPLVDWQVTWTQMAAGREASLNILDHLDEVEGNLHPPYGGKKRIEVSLSDPRTWRKFVALHRPTDGKYTGWTSPASRVIVMEDIAVPWAQLYTPKPGEPEYNRVPPLRFWTDMAAQFYTMNDGGPGSGGPQRPPLFEAHPGQQNSNPHMMRYPHWFLLKPPQVEDSTIRTVRSLLLRHGIDHRTLPQWPGITFPAGSWDYDVLLGDPLIKNVVYFLLQYKFSLGDISIDSITVWDSGETQNDAANGQDSEDPQVAQLSTEPKQPDHVPWFLIHTVQNNYRFFAAKEANEKFEASKQWPFMPHDQTGPLSSKSGPHWPCPMRPVTKNGYSVKVWGGGEQADPELCKKAMVTYAGKWKDKEKAAKKAKAESSRPPAPDPQAGPAPPSTPGDDQVPDWSGFPPPSSH